MSSNKVRVGMIGAGSMAVAHHLPNLVARGDELEMVAVCRKGKPLLEQIQRDFGFRVASEDYRDVLDAGVDVVVVASPTAMHHEHARAALEAGAHVLCEKPMTVSPEQAWDLVDLAAAKDRHLVLSFGWNFERIVRQAKQLVRDVGLGEIEQCTIHMASATRELLTNTGSYPGASEATIPEQATWTDPRLSGGGYAQAQLSHALGLALWLADDLQGERVFAFMGSPGNAPVELHDALALRFRNGAVGTLGGGSCHLGSNENKHQLEVRLIGSEGQLHVDLERELVWLYSADGRDHRAPVADGDGTYGTAGPPDALIDLALGRDVENCAPGDLGARTVEILDAAYRSAASGSAETVALRPSAAS